VVVVGNVVVGGAGKTPTVMALVRHLQRSGKNPAVLSRGYGRRSKECLEVFSDSPSDDVGDEPLLIKRSTSAPVFVASRRFDAGRAALAHYPDIDVLICDDGLQHVALHRDLEICVFDDRGIGNGYLLPAGPLREPWPRSTDLILHTGTRRTFHGFLADRYLADFGWLSDGVRVKLPPQSARPILALAGIATPENFFSMLRDKGWEVQRTLPLPDHWEFTHRDISLLSGWQILCTEKDAVKLWRLIPDAIAVPMCFEPEPSFFGAFDALMSQ
jgi:tetraacyldisaccharide 4'-kinase